MKIKGGTLQSIKNIVDSRIDNRSQVRFNRFTGKAVVVGSPGSKFGLVSWVRKLYTTSSEKKIKKFVLNGVQRKHGGHGKEYGGILSDSLVFTQRLKLRTIEGLKEWHKNYTNLVDKKTRLRNVGIEIGYLVNKFKLNPGSFDACIGSEEYGELASVSQEEMGVYRIAGLKAVKDRDEGGGGNVLMEAAVKAAAEGTAIGKYVNDCTQKPSDSLDLECANYESMKAAVRDSFHQLLKDRLKQELDASRNYLQPFVVHFSDKQNFRSHGEGDRTWSTEEGNRAQALLDTHYKIIEEGVGGGFSDVEKKKSLFHQQLKVKPELKKEVVDALRLKFTEHNSDITKTILFKGKLLENLGTDLGTEARSGREAALDTVLLQEIDKIFEDQYTKTNVHS